MTVKKTCQDGEGEGSPGRVLAAFPSEEMKRGKRKRRTHRGRVNISTASREWGRRKKVGNKTGVRNQAPSPWGEKTSLYFGYRGEGVGSCRKKGKLK